MTVTTRHQDLIQKVPFPINWHEYSTERIQEYKGEMGYDTFSPQMEQTKQGPPQLAQRTMAARDIKALAADTSTLSQEISYSYCRSRCHTFQFQQSPSCTALAALIGMSPAAPLHFSLLPCSQMASGSLRKRRLVLFLPQTSQRQKTRSKTAEQHHMAPTGSSGLHAARSLPAASTANPSHRNQQPEHRGL